MQLHPASLASLIREPNRQHDFLPVRIANAFAWFANKDWNRLQIEMND
jgi:hypothetical protein